MKFSPFKIYIILLGVGFSQVSFAGDSLDSLFYQLTDYYTSDHNKIELSEKITQKLSDSLSSNAKSTFAIRQLRVVHSEDSLFTMYSWQYCLSDATFRYGGVVSFSDRIVPLHYDYKSISNYKRYDQNSWPGGVCYKAIPLKLKKTYGYTILSWDGHNGVTSKKIIDVVTFDKHGGVVFGAPIFVSQKEESFRLSFEYSSKNSLLLDYDSVKECIVTNSLHSNDIRFTDVSSMHGAGETYNAYRYENYKWVLYEDVDLRLDKSASKRLNYKVSPSKNGSRLF